MQIWVDADACPSDIKPLLYRVAERTKTKVILVANQPMRTPRSEFVGSLLVPAGMNIADQRIAELVEPGDLVITADIPLAAKVVERGAEALNPRGDFYTEDNIGQRLAARNLMDELRGGGQITGGPRISTPRIAKPSRTALTAGSRRQRKGRTWNDNEEKSLDGLLDSVAVY